MTHVEIRHGHLFCGLGGGAKGFNRARPAVGSMQGVFRCIGGIDVDAAAIRDFERLSGVRGTVLDLFDREQYVAFHGQQPPADWREAGPGEIHRAFGYERPHIVFLSAPCKGFSGLLSETKSLTTRYQALNRLTLRGVWLMLEAFKDDPIELVLFENVPRIATRGRHLLDQITGLLRSYGYADARLPHMREIAAMGWRTWVSYEPALGPVDWAGWEFLTWMVSGGESGASARPHHPDWHRDTRDYCAAHGIAYHFKQWGTWAPGSVFHDRIPSGQSHDFGGDLRSDDERMWKVGKKAAGRLLDGVTHDGFPEVL